jgi:hypothetical protein
MMMRPNITYVTPFLEGRTNEEDDSVNDVLGQTSLDPKDITKLTTKNNRQRIRKHKGART